MPVSWTDLLDTLEFVSSGQPGEHEAVVCRESGKFFWRSQYFDADEWPDDIGDKEKYVRIPVPTVNQIRPY